MANANTPTRMGDPHIVCLKAPHPCTITHFTRGPYVRHGLNYSLEEGTSLTVNYYQQAILYIDTRLEISAYDVADLQENVYLFNDILLKDGDQYHLGMFYRFHHNWTDQYQDWTAESAFFCMV